MPKNTPLGIVKSFDLYAPKLVDRDEYFSGGHRACQGCGEALGAREDVTHREHQERADAMLPGQRKVRGLLGGSGSRLTITFETRTLIR